jgi:hypothetical protein
MKNSMRLYCCELAWLLPRATPRDLPALPPRPTTLRGGGFTAVTSSSSLSGFGIGFWVLGLASGGVMGVLVLLPGRGVGTLVPVVLPVLGGTGVLPVVGSTAAFVLLVFAGTDVLVLPAAGAAVAGALVAGADVLGTLGVAGVAASAGTLVAGAGVGAAGAVVAGAGVDTLGVASAAGAVAGAGVGALVTGAGA